MRKTFFALCATVIGMVGSAQALPLVDIGLEVGSVSRAPSGTLQYMAGGDNADLKNTLNLGDKSDVVARLKVKHSVPVIPNIYIHYLPMGFTGDKTNATTVTYGGQTYQANTAIHTELTLNSLDIGLFYDLPFIKTATAGIIDPEIGLNIRNLSFKGALTGTVAGSAATVSKTADIPLPLLYLGLGVYPIDLLSFNAELKTLSAGSNNVTEYTIEMAVHPIPVFYIAAGYSSQSIKIDANDIKADIKFAGPYFAAGASF